MIRELNLLVAVHLLIDIAQLLGYVDWLRICGELVDFEGLACRRLYPVYHRSVSLWVD